MPNISVPVAYIHTNDVFYTVKSEYWLKAALSQLAECVVANDKTDLPVFEIPAERVKWSKASRSVQMCGYSATEDFLKKIMGVTLDSADKSWYEDCSLLTSNGLPENMTATVLHALVVPYGIGVSRIRLNPGYIATEELVKWQKCLGRNPMDIMTNNTPAEEFIKESGVDIGINGMRFDHGDEPLRPSVIAYLTSAELGHTTYISPRSGAGKSFIMSIQFDRLSNIVYPHPPPVLDYQEDVSKVPSLWDIIGDNGKKITNAQTTQVSSYQTGLYGWGDSTLVHAASCVCQECKNKKKAAKPAIAGHAVQCTCQSCVMERDKVKTIIVTQDGNGTIIEKVVGGDGTKTKPVLGIRPWNPLS